jgi:hypothetical protein
MSKNEFTPETIGALNKLLSEMHGFRKMAKLAVQQRRADDFDNQMSNIATALDRIAKLRK